MRIDSSHKPWLTISLVVLIAGTAVYIPYATGRSASPGGDTLIGLAFGLIGAAMILFAALLGLRKKWLTLRVGSLTWWMKGHLWLGALSLLMVLFHGNFHFGGVLTTVLMVLLFVIIFSGVFGAVLQHVLPGVMTAQVPRETTYEQVQEGLGNLRREAYELVWSACGETPDPDEAAEIGALLSAPPKKPAKNELQEPGSIEGQEELNRFYKSTIVPYLQSSSSPRNALAGATAAAVQFDAWKVALDPALHRVLDDLAAVCAEARQIVRQIRLHRWLHGWLLVHIPLSMALLVLMLVHAVMALYY